MQTLAAVHPAWWSLAGGALYTGLMMVFNAVWWPSDRDRVATGPRLSVLIPARNEERNIERAVRGALAATPPVHEVIVCDDGSTDATPALLDRLAAEDQRLRVIQGKPLPEGWIGKPHACHQLGEAATGDVLVFVDADVSLSPTATGRIWAALATHEAGLLSMFPRQITRSFGEALTLPMLPVTFAAWFPLLAVRSHPDPRLMTVSGQMMVYTRETYEDIGGYAAIRQEIVDDVAMTVRAKEHGHRVVFTTGDHTATCRMYEGFRDLFEGFSKNLFEGLGESYATLTLAIAAYVGCFVVPYVHLGADLALAGTPSLPALAGVTANVLGRTALALRLRHPWWSVVLHPVAVLIAVAIALNSARWSRAGAVQWRGRTYEARKDR